MGIALVKVVLDALSSFRHCWDVIRAGSEKDMLSREIILRQESHGWSHGIDQSQGQDLPNGSEDKGKGDRDRERQL